MPSDRGLGCRIALRLFCAFHSPINLVKTLIVVAQRLDTPHVLLRAISDGPPTLMDFTPLNMSHFYSHNGGHSTQSCLQTVSWIVFESPSSSPKTR
ncbi:hypothetical protein AMELA_G00286110 [Ameiurus melas]|uniref:Alpha-carbonic anhydrase domain-containing protein n=1 Tax=Ameiurus melas TaxID=219545 RepID=A0A7J5ZL18_AMEME|nr:hypothetical protein AMELA_G00286110 [Ameiurus melas]